MRSDSPWQTRKPVRSGRRIARRSASASTSRRSTSSWSTASSCASVQARNASGERGSTVPLARKPPRRSRRSTTSPSESPGASATASAKIHGWPPRIACSSGFVSRIDLAAAPSTRRVTASLGPQPQDALVPVGRARAVPLRDRLEVERREPARPELLLEAAEEVAALHDSAAPPRVDRVGGRLDLAIGHLGRRELEEVDRDALADDDDLAARAEADVAGADLLARPAVDEDPRAELLVGRLEAGGEVDRVADRGVVMEQRRRAAVADDHPSGR